MRNVLFSCGNAPGLPTGYGGQGFLALKAFVAQGLHVTVLAWNLSAPMFQPHTEYTTEDVIRMSPSMSDITKHDPTFPWASIRWMCNPYNQFPCTIQKRDLNKMIVDTNADLFVALQDIFMFEPGPFLCLSAVWLPLHFTPVEHPTVLSLSDFDLQLPISGWGATLLSALQGNETTMRHVEVVPHGRDITVFSPGDAIDTRAKWGWPEDAFVCLMVASNSEESGRKAFDAQIQAFKHFADKNPRAWLHIHAETTRAYDIPRILEIFGLFETRSAWVDWKDGRKRTLGDAVIRGSCVSITSAHLLTRLDDNDMANMYRAADVLLAATCSEGCGVPILEAQLCGTPVVTTRTTAMWEETMLGVSVPPCQWIARSDFNSGWWLPDARAVGDALYDISQWTSEHLADERAKHLPRLHNEFGNETIVRKWGNVLTKCNTPEMVLSKGRLLLLEVSTKLRKTLRLASKMHEELEVQKKILGKQLYQRSIQEYLQQLYFESL